MEEAAGMHPLFVIPTATDLAMYAGGIVMVTRSVSLVVVQGRCISKVGCGLVRIMRYTSVARVGAAWPVAIVRFFSLLYLSLHFVLAPKSYPPNSMKLIKLFCNPEDKFDDFNKPTLSESSLKAHHLST
jgi:hypothetical protein